MCDWATLGPNMDVWRRERSPDFAQFPLFSIRRRLFGCDADGSHRSVSFLRMQRRDATVEMHHPPGTGAPGTTHHSPATAARVSAAGASMLAFVSALASLPIKCAENCANRPCHIAATLLLKILKFLPLSSVFDMKTYLFSLFKKIILHLT